MLITVLVAAKEFESKRFNVDYVITYNEITLEEASRIEDIVKNKFKDACELDVKVNKASILMDDIIGREDMTITDPQWIVTDTNEGKEN